MAGNSEPLFAASEVSKSSIFLRLSPFRSSIALSSKASLDVFYKTTICTYSTSPSVLA